MTDNAKPFAFSQFVPGFDFLRSLTGGGSGGAVPGLPGLSNWVAPTLSVEELDKRISELKTVQYWLEQNGHALKATIQALEVQKMTLSTLKGMNVQMEDLANAFTRGTASAAAAMRDAASSVAAPAPEPAAPQARAAAAPPQAPEAEAVDAAEESEEAEEAPSAEAGSGTRSAGGAPGQGVVDTLQWWNSLTQQFQQIASNALQDAAQVRMPGVPAAPAAKAAASKAGASAPRKAAKPAPPAASRRAKTAPAKAAKSATARKPATRPR